VHLLLLFGTYILRTKCLYNYAKPSIYLLFCFGFLRGLLGLFILEFLPLAIAADLSGYLVLKEEQKEVNVWYPSELHFART
jgi:hypothetical protein